MADPISDDPGRERVPTWREGVIPSREERAGLTEDQLRQYLDDSVVRDLSEIDQMPEPLRTWALAALEHARSRAQARIEEQEQRQAS
jgi:hypothetical protein